MRKKEKYLPKKWQRKPALENDANELIYPPVRLQDENGQDLAYVLPFPEPTAWYENEVLKKIKYNTSTRTSGLKTTSRIFGYRPRNEFRKFYAADITSLASESPAAHNRIFEMAQKISALYYKISPKEWQDQMHQLEKVHEDWKIPGTPFTSGIINQSNPLNYHYDSGNFRGVKSAMIVHSHNTAGGNLVFPEYDIKFACPNNSVFIFDGQSILHGVTPIIKQTACAYRYSTVFYSLELLKKSLGRKEEFNRARMREWERLA